MHTETAVPTTLGTPRAGAALAAAGVSVVAWASAFVVIRSVGQVVAPAPLALGRLVVGSLTLGALLVARRSWVAPTRREWALLVLCGVTWFATYNLALNAAEQRLDAGTTAMLVNVGPVLITLAAGVLLGEGFPRWPLVGAAVAFSGVLVIGVAGAGAADIDPVGVLLCLLAAVGYAVGVLAQKPVLRRLPALQVTWIACTVGVLVCLPAGTGLIAEVRSVPAGALAGLLYLGLVPTALAFSTWAYALARTAAGRLGVTTYLVPPLTIVGAWALLGEVPPPAALVGGAVCLVGVAVSRFR